VDRLDLAADINAACLSGVFTLRSGLTSHGYFDKYLFESDPRLLKRVAEAMVSLVLPTPTCSAVWSLAGFP